MIKPKMSRSFRAKKAAYGLGFPSGEYTSSSIRKLNTRGLFLTRL